MLRNESSYASAEVVLASGSCGVLMARLSLPCEGLQMGHVLVVDDDLAFREWLRLGLARAGFTVSSVGNGREALEHLRTGPMPTFLLLDLHMPVLDGWQFRREQQTHPVYATVPVILLSSQPDLEEQAVSLAVVACLRKPVESLDGLLKLIRSLDEA